MSEEYDPGKRYFLPWPTFKSQLETERLYWHPLFRYGYHLAHSETPTVNHRAVDSAVRNCLAVMPKRTYSSIEPGEVPGFDWLMAGALRYNYRQSRIHNPLFRIMAHWAKANAFNGRLLVEMSCLVWQYLLNTPSEWFDTHHASPEARELLLMDRATYQVYSEFAYEMLAQYPFLDELFVDEGLFKQIQLEHQLNADVMDATWGWLQTTQRTAFYHADSVSSQISTVPDLFDQLIITPGDMVEAGCAVTELAHQGRLQRYINSATLPPLMDWKQITKTYTLYGTTLAASYPHKLLTHADQLDMQAKASGLPRHHIQVAYQPDHDQCYPASDPLETSNRNRTTMNPMYHYQNQMPGYGHIPNNVIQAPGYGGVQAAPQMDQGIRRVLGVDRAFNPSNKQWLPAQPFTDAGMWQQLVATQNQLLSYNMAFQTPGPNGSMIRVFILGLSRAPNGQVIFNVVALAQSAEAHIAFDNRFWKVRLGLFDATNSMGKQDVMNIEGSESNYPQMQQQQPPQFTNGTYGNQPLTNQGVPQYQPNVPAPAGLGNVTIQSNGTTSQRPAAAPQAATIPDVNTLPQIPPYAYSLGVIASCPATGEQYGMQDFVEGRFNTNNNIAWLSSDMDVVRAGRAYRDFHLARLKAQQQQANTPAVQAPAQPAAPAPARMQEAVYQPSVYPQAEPLRINAVRQEPAVSQHMAEDLRALREQTVKQTTAQLQETLVVEAAAPTAPAPAVSQPEGHGTVTVTAEVVGEKNDKPAVVETVTPDERVRLANKVRAYQMQVNQYMQRLSACLIGRTAVDAAKLTERLVREGSGLNGALIKHVNSFHHILAEEVPITDSWVADKNVLLSDEEKEKLKEEGAGCRIDLHYEIDPEEASAHEAIGMPGVLTATANSRHDMTIDIELNQLVKPHPVEITTRLLSIALPSGDTQNIVDDFLAKVVHSEINTVEDAQRHLAQTMLRLEEAANDNAFDDPELGAFHDPSNVIKEEQLLHLRQVDTVMHIDRVLTEHYNQVLRERFGVTEGIGSFTENAHEIPSLLIGLVVTSLAKQGPDVFEGLEQPHDHPLVLATLAAWEKLSMQPVKEMAKSCVAATPGSWFNPVDPGEDGDRTNTLLHRPVVVVNVRAALAHLDLKLPTSGRGVPVGESNSSLLFQALMMRVKEHFDFSDIPERDQRPLYFDGVILQMLGGVSVKVVENPLYRYDDSQLPYMVSRVVSV